MEATAISPSIHARAEKMLAYADRWAKGVRHRDGLRFYMFASSRKPKEGKPWDMYMTRFDGRGCTCPGARETMSGLCVHQIAARRRREQAEATVERQTVATRKRYEALFPEEQTEDAF